MSSNLGRLWRALSVALAAGIGLCAGCGGDGLRVPDSGLDMAASGSSDALAEDGLPLAADAAISADAQQSCDTGAVDSPDAAASSDAGQFLDTVAPDSRGSETRDTGRECSGNPQPRPDIPSRQTVHFQFVSSSSGYLITAGIQCGAFVIDRLDGDGGPQALLLGAYQLFICEGPVPSAPGVARAAALNQAAVSVLSWDARELQPYQVCVDCATLGWPGMPNVTVTFTSSAPVGPGRYRATFAVMDTLPAQCRGDSGEYSCDSYLEPGWAPFGPWGLCPETSRTLSVEFDLPADGDLDVTVADQG